MENKENNIPIFKEEVRGGRNPLMEEEVKSNYCENCRNMLINVRGSECVRCGFALDSKKSLFGHPLPPEAAAGDDEDRISVTGLRIVRRGYQKTGIMKKGKVKENEDDIPAVQFTREKIDGQKDEKGKAKVENQDQVTAVRFPVDGLKEEKGKGKAEAQYQDDIAAVQIPREKIDGQREEEEAWEREIYKCERCWRSFQTRRSLGAHMAHHTRRNKLIIINIAPPPPEETSSSERIVVADASAADYLAFDLNMPAPAEDGE